MVKLKVKGGEYLKSLFSRFTFYVKNREGCEKQTGQKSFEMRKAKGESFGGVKPPSPN